MRNRYTVLNYTENHCTNSNHSLKEKSSSKPSFRALAKQLVLFVFLLFSVIGNGWGQVNNYTATRNTGITFNSISVSGTSFAGWRNGTTNTDDNLSGSTNIGFNFSYDGATRTTFSVSTNGYLTFNTGTAATGGGTVAYGYQNTRFSNATGTFLTLAPFYDDQVCVGNPTTAAGLASSIKYQLTGVAPNRVLTVEWIGMEVFSNAGPNLNYQVKLYETTNAIEFVYGTMAASTATYSYSLGLNGSTISATPTATQLFTQQTNNTATFSALAVNNLSTIPASNSRIVFTPLTPTISAVASLSSFSTCSGTASTAQSFTISGANMAAGVTITPPVGYEVSTSSTFASNIGTNASPLVVGAAGTIASTPIFVRLQSTATGTPSGNITLTSTNATTQNVAVSGTVNSTANPTGTISNDAAICGNVTLTYSSPDASIYWQTSASGTSTSLPTTSSYILSSSGTIFARAFNSTTGCWSTGTVNSGAITVAPQAPPTVSIAASPSGTICAGTSVTFTPTATTEGSAPVYEWYLNGTQVSTGSTYTSSAFANGDQVYCVLTSNSSCAPSGNNTATSATTTLSVTSFPTAQAIVGTFTNNIPGTGVTVNWTRGNGATGVIVVARATATANVAPSSGTTYTANANFGSGTGSALTGTGNFVVYVGTGTSVAVTGLAANTDYTYTVYEYSGTCYLTPGASSSVTTPVSNALSFDGTNDRVNCGQSASLNITGTAITLEAWIFPTSWRAESWRGNIINRETNSFTGYMLRCGASGTLSFNLGNGTAWVEVSSTSGALTLNTWQHVAGTYDGTTLRLYVNGVQVNTFSSTSTISNAAGQNLTIGNWSQDDTRAFPGLIDEVRIWGVARTAAELVSGMTQSPDGCATGLRASYSFNHGIANGANPSVTTLIAATPNANNGTLANLALTGTSSNWVPGRAGITPAASSVCSGTPAPGNTTASSTTVTPGTVVTLGLQNAICGSGVTYQWQASTTSATAGFSDVSGAISATYAPTVNQTTWYRCNVTCTGNTGTSVAVQVVVNYCNSTGPAVQGSDYFTNFTITNGISNINNPSTYSTNGYGNFTAQIASQYTGISVNFSMVSPGVGNGTSFGIFIDWNEDFDFSDPGEAVYNSNGNVTVNPSGSFIVPLSASPGTKRMRIVCQDAGAAVGSCNTQVNGETEDYSFTVVALPACTAPISLAATASSSAQTTTTISGSFTAATSAPTGYVVVRTDVNTQPTPVTATSYTVGPNAIGFIEYVGTSAGSWTSSSLAPGTTYYYWVFSYNNTTCAGGPVYSASSTNFLATTVSCPTTSLAGLTFNVNPVSYCLSAPITANPAILATTAGNVTYTVTPSLPSGLTLNASTGVVSGTPTSLVSAADYTVTADNGCTNTSVALNITILAIPASAPTSSAATNVSTYSFSANWTQNGLTTYLLDVATDAAFTNLVSGYNGLDVGNVSTFSVTGLSASTQYWFRVRGSNGTCPSVNSSSQTLTTTGVTSAATGDWNVGSTWVGGIVPTCSASVTIANGHNVTVNTASNVSRNLTISSGGTLTVASGDLTVGCTLRNTPLTNNGTLTVTGGTLNVNGNIVSALGSTFNQSGGNINIDGNNGGSATGSVASGTALLQFNQLNSGINLTGGTLTIIDPHANSTSSNSIGLNNATTGTQTSTAGHTLRFGDGISTDAGGNVNGFRVDPWTSNAFLSFGNIIVNGATGTNRSVTCAYQLAAVGDVTVTTGSTLNLSSALVAAQNVTVNTGGTFINLAGIATAIIASNTNTQLTFGPSTFSQTIGGTGTYQNLLTSPTANLNSLIVNNTSATGVTISTPISISGTLTMTTGKINTTATNLLTLGTATTAGTLAYTAGQITGPFARTFAANRTATGTYDVSTLFPVGDGTTYLPVHIDPSTSAGGAVVMRGQAFATNAGTAGNGVANPLSQDRWEALAIAGSANLTNSFIGLNDAQIVPGNIIVQSSAANGTYNVIVPTSTVTGLSIRTATAILAANYLGYFTYSTSGPAITSFSPAGVCANTAATITITGTNLGNASAVTLNGEACTIVSNTPTQIVITTDATPQAGNIVVTTSQNTATSPTPVVLNSLPTISASFNPSNTICNNQSTVITAAGASSYSWSPALGLSSTSGTFVTANPSASSIYTITGTDANGCVNTTTASVTVNLVVAITSQPASQVVLPNDNATFTVSATGTGLTYQWQESIDNGANWTDITNGGIYSGTTDATLTLTNVTSQNGYQYQVLINGVCSGVTSDIVTLTISSTAIAQQPQSQSICESTGTASFSITTTGTPAADYQWQVSTNNGNSWSNISGANASTLSLSGLFVTNNGELYRCLLNNGSIISNNALLTVSAPSVAGTASASQAICVGTTPTGLALAGSTGTIQWQVSSDNNTFNAITNATSSALSSAVMGTLTTTQYYQAIVTSGACAAATSNLVTITVTPTPNAGTISGTQNVCVNATTTFASSGNAGGTWSSSNTAVATVNASTGVITGVSAGSATITYTINGTGGCSTVSANRAVTVNSLPTISTATASPSTVCSGATVNLVASSVQATTGTAIVGTGTTQGANSTTFVRVGNTVGNQFKNQYLFTATELTAAGLTTGNITSLTFDVFVSGGGTVSNLTFRIGTTALTSLTSTYVTGLTQVYTTGTYPPTGTLQVGLQTVTFDTPFFWDGTSNLVLEGCSQLATGGTAGDLRSGTTTFTSTITNSPSTAACGSTTGLGTSSVRPNFRFGGQVGTNISNTFNWAWNSTPAVNTATGSTVATNTGLSGVSQSYTVTVTNPTTGCTNSSVTAPITINAVPSAPDATSSASCGPNVPTGTVASTSGLTNPNVNWYTAATGGNLVLTSYTGPLTTYYTNDFSANTGIGVMTGNASLAAGRLELTPNAATQLGALTIPESGISADKYKVTFDLFTSNAAELGADGLSYSFGDDVSGTSTTVNAETGSGSKLKISFDDYDLSGNGVAGIRVIYGNTISLPGTTIGTNGVLAYNSTTSWTNGTAPVIIDINNLGQLTLTVNGSAIFTNLQLPAAFINADKSTWKHGFKARTGGVFMTHAIDNVTIQQSSYLEATNYPLVVPVTTTYYAIESNAGCSSTATPITFTVNTPPAMTLSAATAAACAGSSTSAVTLTSNAANYTSYSWSPSATVSGTAAAGWNFAPTTATTYTLTGTNASTGCANTATVAVSINALPPAVTVTPSASTICPGNIQSLVATGGSIPSVIPNYNVANSLGTYTPITGATVSTSAVGDDNVHQNLPIGFNFTYGGSTFTNFGFSTNGLIQLGNTTIVGVTNALASNVNVIAPFWDDNFVSSGTGSVSHVLTGSAPNRVLTVQWNNVSIGGGGSSANATNRFQVNLFETTNVVQFIYGGLTAANGITGSIGLSGGTSGSYLSVTPNATPSTSSVSENNGISSVTNLTSGTTYTFTPPTPSTISWAPLATLFTNTGATTAYTGSAATTVYAKPDVTTAYTATATNAAGCTSSATATLTLSTAGNALSSNESATCSVKENGWIHFYGGSGNLVASINSGGYDLGAVSITSYVDPSNALVPACTNPNPIYATSVMQRHWVITPTNNPPAAAAANILVRFPFSDDEFNSLNFAAFNNNNSNDNVGALSDIKLSRYSNGTAANVNGSATDNCGTGTSTIHAQVASGSLSSLYPQIANPGQYVTFSIPGFSEFWLHGSATDSPLPVELVNFQANCAGEGKVNVTWATASEHNSANFTVEKSRDGINWTVLATVAGAGNSTQLINYSVDDNNAAAGINYYRLTQTDIDGASETFNIASANCGDNAPLTTVKVYPNPSAGDFYIDFTSEEIVGESVITITDSRGADVYTQTVTVEKGSNVFHIEQLDAAPGLYYIKVSNGTATSNIVKHSLR